MREKKDTEKKDTIFAVVSSSAFYFLDNFPVFVYCTDPQIYLTG